LGKISIFGLASNSIDFFNNLAFGFGVKSSQDNILKIPSRTGTGLIRKFEIAPGIDLVLFDFYLKQNITLKKMIAVSPGEKMLSVICTLTPAGLAVARKDDASPEKEKDIPAILLTSVANELAFFIFPDHIVKAVIINFEMESLERECKTDNSHLYQELKKFVQQQAYLHFKEQASVAIYHKLVELHGHTTRNQSDKAAVKSQTMSVLLDIVRLVLAKYSHDDEGNAVLRSKMEVVRDMLAGYVESKLPPIPVIARNIAVSESTLKRNFKQVYGTSIYDYYLQIKMERARALFAEKPLSVKEVAYRLGYEKTSSFIRIFRKFYNFSPGELKRRMITD
jgi:AraC-like DNA-binding protein